MTTKDQQLYDGSLIVIAEKWEIPARKIGNKDATKSRVVISKRPELKAHVLMINNIKDAATKYIIDEEATLVYLKKKAGISDDSELEVLQDSYREKFGEEPKKIWGVKKLSELING